MSMRIMECFSIMNLREIERDDRNIAFLFEALGQALANTADEEISDSVYAAERSRALNDEGN